MQILLMVDRLSHRQSVERGKREPEVRRAQCPVSSSDGTARPGHMSDCFFDLRACATQPCALAFKPMTEKLTLDVAYMKKHTLKKASIFMRRWRVRQVCQGRSQAKNLQQAQILWEPGLLANNSDVRTTAGSASRASLAPTSVIQDWHQRAALNWPRKTQVPSLSSTKASRYK